MTYKVFFYWLDDGFEDTFNCKGLKELKYNIEDMNKRGVHKITGIDQVNKYGEGIPYRKIKY